MTAPTAPPAKPKAKKKAEPKSDTLKAMKANLPKDRKTGKFKAEFDPTTFDQAKPAGIAKTNGKPFVPPVGKWQMLDLALIDHNPKNARTEKEIEADPATQELADTVATIGLIQPLIVRPNGKRFMLEGGARRRIACKRAGLKQVPCIVRADDNDTQAIEVRVIENLQRKDLTPIQEARDLFELQTALKLGQVELGKKVGKSQGYVSQRLSLLKLSASLQDMVATGQLSVTQGREIAVLADIATVVTALEKEFAHRLKNYDEHGGDGKTIDHDNFCYAVGGVLDVHMGPMQPTGAKSPSFHPTPEQLSDLDVRQICLDGSTQEKWAANLKLWNRLQKEAKALQEDERAAKAAGKTTTPAAPAAPATPGPSAATTQETGDKKPTATPAATEKTTPKPEAKPLSADEQKERDERNALMYQRKLYRYKIKWLQMALAKRASSLTQEQSLVLWIAFALYGSDQKRSELFGHAVKEVMGSRFSFSYDNIYALDRGKLPKLMANYFDRWCQRDARNVTGDANPQLIEILARELAVEIDKEWKLDAAFLEIHTIDQIWDLVAEWKLEVDQTISGKGPLVEFLIKKYAKPGAVTFPKALAKVKPVHLD